MDPAMPMVIMTAFGSIDSAVDAVRTRSHRFRHQAPRDRRTWSWCSIAHHRAPQDPARRSIGFAPTQTPANTSEGMVGRSLPMKQVYSLIDKVASSDLTVLVLGLTGTGKEVCARAIHDLSPRAKQRFQVVNCAGLQETLLESELFGHEKGSFTGADRRKLGHFEVATGGTLFLDEVGEAPHSVQAKLLRAIQEKEIVRVGGTDPIKVDVRIVAATNRDLEAEAKTGSFREDLYYRLSPFPIHLAPLKDRLEDVPLLIEHFNPTGPELSLEASLALTRYEWPGNVRQLKNVMARASVLAGDSPIDVAHLPPEVLDAAGVVQPNAGAIDSLLLELPLREARQRFEHSYIDHLLRRCRGNVSEAARQAGMGRASMHDKINKLGIDPHRYRQER